MLAGLVDQLLEFGNFCLELGNFGAVFDAVGAVVSSGRGCGGEDAVVVRCHEIGVEEGKGLGRRAFEAPSLAVFVEKTSADGGRVRDWIIAGGGEFSSFDDSF